MLKYVVIFILGFTTGVLFILLSELIYIIKEDYKETLMKDYKHINKK